MPHPKRKDSSRRAVKAVQSSAPGGSQPYLPGAEPDAPLLLAAIASALNDAETSGIPVKLAHGAVITDAGYVFGIGPDGARWVARSRMLLDFDVPEGTGAED